MLAKVKGLAREIEEMMNTKLYLNKAVQGALTMRKSTLY